MKGILSWKEDITTLANLSKEQPYDELIDCKSSKINTNTTLGDI